MRYDSTVHGHFGIAQTLFALGLSLLVFEPKWQALTKFRSLTVYVIGILVLIVGVLALFAVRSA
jgi:hypothetical protein